MKRLLLVAVLALAASCRDVTAPAQDDARIVFRVGASCNGSSIYSLFIDGQMAGLAAMAPGDTAGFTVAPGQHSVGAAAPVFGGGVALWFPQIVTLAPAQQYVQVLACSPLPPT